MPVKTLFLFLSVLFFTLPACADTLYLKNGRNIEGLIKDEDARGVELDIGFGTVMFPNDEIARISRSSTDEARAIQQEWQKQKEKADAEKAKKEQEPKGAKLHSEDTHLGVDAVLNKRVPIFFVIDTGASMVVLSKKIGEKLGIQGKESDQILELILVDGRKIRARYVVLDSIQIEDTEARDIEAAILLDDIENIGFKDGLLGMSFFKKFNFMFDQKNKRLILEKL